MMLSTQVALGTAAALGAPLKNGDVIARSAVKVLASSPDN
jgi:hypothetical protein